MSRDDLRTMFVDLAEDVSRPALVATAIARATAIRRRRRVVVAAALALVLGSTAGLVALRPGPATDQVNGPAYIGSVRVDRLPASIPRGDESGVWPRAIDLPRTVPSLRDAPMHHVNVLYSPPGSTTVYAYGEARTASSTSGIGRYQWVRIDTDLSDVVDIGGNRAIPVGPNAIGPFGQRVVLAQLRALVVVDFRDGSVIRIPLFGLHQVVTWLLDGRHILMSGPLDTLLYSLDREPDPVDTGSTDVKGLNIAPLVSGVGDEGISLVTLNGRDELPLLTRYSPAGDTELSRRPLAIDGVTALVGRAWQQGNTLAQAVTGRLGEATTTYVALVDVNDGSLLHILDLGPRAGADCCTVLGLSGDQVFVRTERDGVLAWNATTGAVRRLIDPVRGELSLSVMSCPTRMTIGGITSACAT